MAADDKQSALMRRHDQIKRWEDSETNSEPVSPKRDKVKVKFQDGCVFLAACSSGDKDEVNKLLKRGADINTANVDGLTALHQACIDDNLEMVEFLVEKGADVDVCDNEGWTPLHATASCAFTEIARYLLKHGANVAAVNNDGDLPLDIAENEEMEKLLQEELDKQGIDADAARCEEEERMLEDANLWLREKEIKDVQHPKTGATALHVAAAKGYIKVMNLLLDAGVDVNAEDYDGWTPLHAAAHWGQEEACKILVEHMCDMMHKNKAGHTAFDLAEKDMLKLLEELKEKQASLRGKQEIDTDPDIILPSGHSGKRRSSVTRMSGDQKQNVIQRTSEEERAALASLHPAKPDDNKTIEDAETERQNEKNKQVSQQIQLPTPTTITTPSSWSRPASVASTTPGAELRRPDMPKIDEVSETDRPSSAPVISLTTATTTVPTVPSITSTLPPTTKPAAGTDTTPSVLSSRPTVSISKVEKLSDLDNGSSTQDSASTGKAANTLSSGRDLVSRSISVPARLPTQKDAPSTTSTTTSSSSTTTTNENEVSVPSWRQGLRKTGSSSMVHDWLTENGSNNLPRSASSPRLDHRLDALHERLAARQPSSSTGSSTATTTAPSSTTTTTTADAEAKSGDRNSYTFGQSTYGYRNYYGGRTGSYVPYYKLREQREAADNKQGQPELGRFRDRHSVSGYTGSSSLTPSPHPTTASATTTTTNSTTNSVFRRSFEPPKRDEETETQRKARAKHARQTRRSTQGVSLEDIEKAEEVLRSNEPGKDKDMVDGGTTTTTSLSSRNSLTNKENNVSAGSGETTTTGIPTATTTTTTSSVSRTGGGSDADVKEDRTITSGYRRRPFEDKNDTADVPSTRSSYRRVKEDRDLNSSSGLATDVTSNYIPRSQRNSALLSSDSSSSSHNLPRSSSLRSSRLDNGETDGTTPRRENDSKKDEAASTQEKKEEKKEPSAIRARRQRRERRSTGIVYDNEDGDKDSKADEDKEEKKEENLGSSRYGSRFSSNSEDPSSNRSQRPVSYSEFSKSTGSLDLDYKKKYEDEKSENDRLRKELEETKKSLLEAKNELDKVMKQRDSRNSDRDKRALERKVSEMEEELKKMEALKEDNRRLKDENSALIRVISKLSK